MSKYLISFPSSAMKLSEADLERASVESREVVREARRAGVWVFGGGIDEREPPVRVDAAGSTAVHLMTHSEHEPVVRDDITYTWTRFSYTWCQCSSEAVSRCSVGSVAASISSAS